ncbi:hypothetical protein D915_002724 [Fasciola hepatica]|uniref:Uncharacterized protein n=1 Tax=Fasciola hepatica TaxID=6192 RepID=A0A4E0RJ33_FASHE|nr:hypothetical protein D915_002724 [Fasciola hepatica]
MTTYRLVRIGPIPTPWPFVLFHGKNIDRLASETRGGTDAPQALCNKRTGCRPEPKWRVLSVFPGQTVYNCKLATADSAGIAAFVGIDSCIGTALLHSYDQFEILDICVKSISNLCQMV